MSISLDHIMAEKKSKSITNTVKQFGDKLLGFVRPKVRTEEDAEDILQDIWYQLTSLNDIEELRNIGAWLYQVARNKIVDRYRKKTTDSLEDFEYQNEEGEFNYKEILLLDDSNDPEIQFFKEMFWEELTEALKDLPPKQREVFELNEIEGFTLQHIADQKGENIKTIISRKGYAVKFLHNRLAFLYNELNN
jgi:RNA polymerase sigma factor (sigma-70 family)